MTCASPLRGETLRRVPLRWRARAHAAMQIRHFWRHGRRNRVHALRERILSEGRNLGEGILKVDGFINHQIDPLLMFQCGKDLASRFRSVGASKVLTAEMSGI